MNRRFYLAIFCALAVAGSPAAAQRPDAGSQSPAAAIYIKKKNVGMLRWFGVGDLRSKNDLCILSQTGRYRLRMEVMSGGQGEAVPPFEISFSTAAGDGQTRQSTDGNVLIFEGRTGSTANCDGATNATLEFRFTSGGLSSAVAGAYIERVQLTVDPV